MESYALKDLPIKHFLAAAQYMVRDEAKGENEKYVYNLVMTDPDGVRVEKENYWLTFNKGEIAYGEGSADAPDATEFTVLQGGLDTLIAMQVHGMKAAMNCMMLGYITASNLKKAEAWYKFLATGEEAVVAALKKAGVEITDTEMPIYDELQLG